jgi:uncharacterized protein (TIGR03790 family)
VGSRAQRAAGVLLSLAAVLAPAPARAILTADEVVVVAPRWSKEAKALAGYYQKARGIPEKNLCLVDMPKGEVISRKDWTWAVRPEIRKWITDNDPDEKIRCLVTVWDVPLKIDRAAAGDLLDYQKFLAGERDRRIKTLGEAIERLDGLAPEVALPPEPASQTAAANEQPDAPAGDASNDEPAAAPSTKPSEQLKQLRANLEIALRAAQERVTQSTNPQVQQLGRRSIEQLATGAGGLQVIAQSLGNRLSQETGDIPDQVREQFDLMRGRITAFNEARLVIEQSAPGIQRDALALAMLERYGGLLGTIEWLDAQLDAVSKNETGASFDSELSLVMWPDEYQLLRWQPNYLSRGFESSQLGQAFRTLMVARIDAPTLKLTKALVDTPLKVEAAGGLTGKIYLDARGIGKRDQPNVAAGSYADYDRALLATADGVTKLYPEQEVVLDEEPALFQPGTCPDAALYCGWYSLAKYIDAFEWKPGAVAYHLASSEASTLRNEQSQVWCKRLLEDGVCATIGPVYEPYLMAFPRPSDFFAELMAGKKTLVECYYHTKPYNSWMMTLIGDPLYRPFKK